MPVYQAGDIILRDYQVEAFLGEGGFGEVYRTCQIHLNQRFALKILRRSRLNAAGYTAAEIRFRKEAQLGVKVNHPAIVRVFSFSRDEESDQLVLVMAYAAGGSLRQELDARRERNQPYSVTDALRISRGIAAGLAALHAENVIHRDLSPNNILFDGAGAPLIADLGLAQTAGEPSLGRDKSDPPPHPGTPGYRSPEHADGYNLLKPPADIYALGLLLFEMLTLKQYDSCRPGTRLSALRPEVPAALDELAAGMLSEDLRQRPWDGAAAGQSLAKLSAADPVSMPMRSAPPSPTATWTLEEGLSALKDMEADQEWQLAAETLEQLEAIFPGHIKLKLPRKRITQALEAGREAQEKAKREAETRAHQAADEKARREAEAQAQREDQEHSRRKAEARPVGENAAQQQAALQNAPDWAERAKKADERGTRAHNANDFDLAIQEYSHAISLDPNTAMYYRNRGGSYHQKGDYDRAIADFTRAIELAPKVADYYRQRGPSYSQKGDYDRAIADYNRAIELDPKVADYYRQRGVSYHNKGDYDRAIADDNRAIELDPRNGEYYHSRSLSHQARGNTAQAAADRKRAEELGYKT